MKTKEKKAAGRQGQRAIRTPPPFFFRLVLSRIKPRETSWHLPCARLRLRRPGPWRAGRGGGPGEERGRRGVEARPPPPRRTLPVASPSLPRAACASPRLFLSLSLSLSHAHPSSTQPPRRPCACRGWPGAREHAVSAQSGKRVGKERERENGSGTEKQQGGRRSRGACSELPSHAARPRRPARPPTAHRAPPSRRPLI